LRIIFYFLFLWNGESVSAYTKAFGDEWNSGFGTINFSFI